ncbi:HdeD family acid-resistance protein [Adhaeretor mobilis]|uniref:Acid-resistance membrane protein n=1 Tax=Adhaeretor mobilis TaxID=1930276 RepID=A0A517MRQ1_9BACT|nr:HdeD family acid-resistance protein [Adhaeretor mobilis]QDS97559.1 acid-resistance membrane protein [Adhaeretor mobilis]
MASQDLPDTTSLTIMGVFLIVFGIIAIATPAVAGTAVVMVIGGILLIAGVAQIVSGLRSDGWSSKLPPLILGAITSLCGLGLLGEPWIGMKFIALLLAIFFTVGGIWKVIASFSYRPASGWLALLLSGILTLVLGVLIWRQWPLSGLWAVGVLVGVDLLTTGISIVAVASTVRRLKSLAGSIGNQ